MPESTIEFRALSPGLHISRKTARNYSEFRAMDLSCFGLDAATMKLLAARREGTTGRVSDRYKRLKLPSPGRGVSEGDQNGLEAAGDAPNSLPGAGSAVVTS